METKECKLKVNDVIFIHHETWELKEGRKYKLNAIVQNRLGGKLYKFMANRKNAVTPILIYVNDIDIEINDKTTSQITSNIEFLFCKSIFIVK